MFGIKDGLNCFEKQIFLSKMSDPDLVQVRYSGSDLAKKKLEIRIHSTAFRISGMYEI
jgi:hypothetical protein